MVLELHEDEWIKHLQTTAQMALTSNKPFSKYRFENGCANIG